MKLLWLVVLVFAIVPCQGADEMRLGESRVWHGKNGKHFRGVFVLRDEDVLHINSSTGKFYKVPIVSLSTEDQKWFTQAWAQRQHTVNKVEGLAKSGEVRVIEEEVKMDSVAPIGFKDVPATMLNRLSVPVIDQKEYHDKNYGSLGSAMVPFLLWWHHGKVLEVPSRRDDQERRLKWLFKELNEVDLNVRSRGRGLQKFFQEDLKCKPMFRMIQLETCDPESLAAQTKGANATVLRMASMKGRRNDGHWSVPVVSCDAQGNILFQMYGLKVHGKMVLVPPDRKSRTPRDRKPQYKITIANSDGHPDWFKDREYSFTALSVMVLVPYLPDGEDEK